MAIDERVFKDMAEKMMRDGRSPEAIRARIEALEAVLERAITVPGTNYKVGLDAIIGLIPIGGDIIAGLLSTYIIWEARNLGMSKWALARMAGNTVFDTAIGAIPLLGDAVDFVFRSNTRNLRIIRKHLDKHHPKTATLEGEIIRRATEE